MQIFIFMKIKSQRSTFIKMSKGGKSTLSRAHYTESRVTGNTRQVEGMKLHLFHLRAPSGAIRFPAGWFLSNFKVISSTHTGSIVCREEIEHFHVNTHRQTPKAISLPPSSGPSGILMNGLIESEEINGRKNPGGRGLQDANLILDCYIFCIKNRKLSSTPY
jgi:hypothetical protein